MTLSQLIDHVGNENIRVQRLDQAMTSCLLRKDLTEIRLMTDVSMNEILTKSVVGLILWIPKERMPIINTETD